MARMRIVVVLALPFALLLGACNPSPSANAVQPELAQSQAESMLLRTLQAVERQDLAGTQADLFPRNPNTLAACAKGRIANAKPATLAFGGEGGAPSITGVQVTGMASQAEAMRVTYQVQGNPALSGADLFVFANGRWWIKCGI